MDRNEDDEVVRPRPAPARSEGVARLAVAVARMPQPVFAIVDGGHFDELPGALAEAGLQARSLFLGNGERDVERHGPWFVTLRGERDLGAVLGIVGERPALVFWSCLDGDVALYGHLRRLNMVRLPAWAAAGKAGPEPGLEADRGWEAVLFRHWDPRVLGALLPVLDEAQFSRIVGPAGEIVFHTEDQGGTKRVVTDREWPAAPGGMLTIRPEQVAGLSERRLEASHRRVAAYLREVFPEAAPAYPGLELQDFVRDADASGRRLGIRTEAAHKRWAYLVMASEGRVTTTPGALHFIQHEGTSPDGQVRRMMDMISDRMRHSRGAATTPW